MKLFLPKQHGAWAMIIIPFWLGVIDGGFMWQHIPFFMGWVLLYLATYPMLLLFKKKKVAYYRKWTILYMVPAIALLIIPFYTMPSLIYFGFLMIPFFILNAYFSSKNQDRAFMNDVSAIIAFSIAGLASSYLGKGEITVESVFLFGFSILFFIGCTFYVKTMIREKKNVTFKSVSWGYHILLPMAVAGFGFWVAAAAFVPSLFRAIFFYGKPLSPMKIGIFEIVNSAMFFSVMVFHIMIN